jgi:hypothetical protein
MDQANHIHLLEDDLKVRNYLTSVLLSSSMVTGRASEMQQSDQTEEQVSPDVAEDVPRAREIQFRDERHGRDEGKRGESPSQGTDNPQQLESPTLLHRSKSSVFTITISPHS